MYAANVSASAPALSSGHDSEGTCKRALTADARDLLTKISFESLCKLLRFVSGNCGKGIDREHRELSHYPPQRAYFAGMGLLTESGTGPTNLQAVSATVVKVGHDDGMQASGKANSPRLFAHSMQAVIIDHLLTAYIQS